MLVTYSGDPSVAGSKFISFAQFIVQRDKTMRCMLPLAAAKLAWRASSAFLQHARYLRVHLGEVALEVGPGCARTHERNGQTARMLETIVEICRPDRRPTLRK
jgi:hypothetical protein